MGLFLLIPLVIYIGVTTLLVKMASLRRLKIFIVILAISFPIVYYNIYYFYPSYYKFIDLCEAGDRKVIYKVKSVDNLYLGRSSRCYRGFTYLASYKSVECEFSPKDNGELGHQRGVFGYVKGDNWLSSSCGKSCLEKPWRTQENECKFSCMKQVKIENITNPYTYEFTKKEIIKDTLYLNENSIVEREEVMATFKNYAYYPHGKNWIGGRPPILSCSNKVFVKNTDIYKPKE